MSVRTALTEDELSHLYMWLQEGVPGCGCGDPDGVDRLVVDLLDLIAKGRFGAARVRIDGSSAVVQIVLGAIEAAGLIGHGTYFEVPWLTERGRWVLDAYSRLDGGIPDEAGFPHGGEPCPESCALYALSAES